MKKLLIIILLLFCYTITTFSQMLRMRGAIKLQGVSSGGTLTLTRTPNGNYPYVCITNISGETAPSAIKRLALKLSKCEPCADWWGGDPVVRVNDNMLTLYGSYHCGQWLFGGTEKGLGIPLPPLSTSCSYSNDNLILKWENPSGGYDSVTIVCLGVMVGNLSGDTESFTHKKIYQGFPDPEKNFTYFVVGCKERVPSNGAGVRLINHTIQESPMNVPFTCGVAPGFKKWQYNTDESSIVFKQGNRPGVGPNRDMKKCKGKGFYQIIEGNGTFTGGVIRKFIGLSPGHTYKISAFINTGKAFKGNWSFSFHASYNSAIEKDLSVEQLAGMAKLPNGSTGFNAGQIAKYDSSAITKHEWILRTTDQEGPGKIIKNITLPKDAGKSITIWFRYTGKNMPSNSVDIHSVSIEDLGDSIDK